MSLRVDVRQMILEEIDRQGPGMDRGLHKADPTGRSVLQEVYRRFVNDGYGSRSALTDPQTKQIHVALLSEFNELFRAGVIGFGTEIDHLQNVYFHVTEAGQRALSDVSRSPSNAEGYLRLVRSQGHIPENVETYLIEALRCYNSGLRTAATVMLGAAVEGLVLDLKALMDVRKGLPTHGKPKSQTARQACDDLNKYFLNEAKLPFELSEKVKGGWTWFTDHIRRTRNDAGHPARLMQLTHSDADSVFLQFHGVFEIYVSLKTFLSQRD